MPVRSGLPRSTVRVPVDAQVTVHFENLAGFVTTCAANISLEGMFIQTEQPRVIGTRVLFELKLRDEFALVQGVGEVAWIRPQEESAERPAGMGIRFLQMDQDDKDVIAFVVNQQIHRDGDPFDLDDE